MAEAELRRLDAPRVLVGGGPLQDREFEDQVAADLARAELLSMPVVLVLLLVVFGGNVAAGLPVLVALVGVAGTLLALFGISAVTDASTTVNVVTMLGLGLATSTTPCCCPGSGKSGSPTTSRRRSRRRRLPPAARWSSGSTVAASLAGLLVFDDPFLRR